MSARARSILESNILENSENAVARSRSRASGAMVGRMLGRRRPEYFLLKK